MSDTGLKLVTISYDDEQGLEVDYEGVSVYEAWALLFHATDLIEGQLGEVADDDDD